jgi:glycosyltransferase involved in cell wall biosynthesis
LLVIVLWFLVMNGKSEIYTLAKMAVQSFLGQTYPNRHLLIVNDGPTPVYTAPPARVIEMRLHPGRRLGQLRNLALEAIQRDSQGFGHVDYVTQWNDDDWSRLPDGQH